MTEKIVPPSPVIPPLDARGLMGQPFMLWTQQLTRTVEELVAGGGGGGVTVHADLTGLSADDHLQYHNDARGDARYYTKTLLNAGQLDTRYYTESEVDSFIAGRAPVAHTHTASQVTDFSAAVFAAGAITAPEMYARQVHFFYGDYL